MLTSLESVMFNQGNIDCQQVLKADIVPKVRDKRKDSNMEEPRKSGGRE